jgi:hypothetical protein
MARQMICKGCGVLGDPMTHRCKKTNPSPIAVAKVLLELSQDDSDPSVMFKTASDLMAHIRAKNAAYMRKYRRRKKETK